MCVQSVNEALLSDFRFTISTEFYAVFLSFTHERELYLLYAYTLIHSYTHTQNPDASIVLVYVLKGWFMHENSQSESPVDK